MIFLTVGSQFPFVRLVKAVDKLKKQGLIEQEIFAQIGSSPYKPETFEYSDFLEKKDFDKYVQNSSEIISHAGMGIISKALELGKSLLAMPRLVEYNEVVNAHQTVIAKKFEKLGHILVAYSTDELPEKIKQLETFTPVKRTAQPEKIAAAITEFIEKWQSKI